MATIYRQTDMIELQDLGPCPEVRPVTIEHSSFFPARWAAGFSVSRIDTQVAFILAHLMHDVLQATHIHANTRRSERPLFVLSCMIFVRQNHKWRYSQGAVVVYVRTRPYPVPQRVGCGVHPQDRKADHPPFVYARSYSTTHIQYPRAPTP